MKFDVKTLLVASTAMTMLVVPALGQSVAVQAGGYDSGPSVSTALNSVVSASHAGGTSVGGLFTIPLARNSNPAINSAIITGVQMISTSGSTGTYILRAWSKIPQSTCSDNSAFSINSADDPYLIVGTPALITPTAPANTTGDARTYGSLTGLTWDFHNADSTPSQNIYACLVTSGTDTADDGGQIRLTFVGPQN